jgi:hypothetical protein
MNILLPFAALLLAACSHTTYQPPVTGPGRDLDAENARNAGDFAREHATFRVAGEIPGDFPRKEFHTFQKHQTLTSGHGVTLSLSLGAIRSGEQGNRTASRYRLRSATGKILALAESILDSGMNEDSYPGVELFSDPESGDFLIAESRAATGTRCILFTRSAGAWPVRYVEVPIREEASFSPMHFSRPAIIGLRGGKVYLQTDGATYAIPFDQLKEVTSLGFGIG